MNDTFQYITVTCNTRFFFKWLWRCVTVCSYIMQVTIPTLQIKTSQRKKMFELYICFSQLDIIYYPNQQFFFTKFKNLKSKHSYNFQLNFVNSFKTQILIFEQKRLRIPKLLGIRVIQPLLKLLQIWFKFVKFRGGEFNNLW